MRRAVLAAAALALAVPVAAQGQPLDVASVTCADFTAQDTETLSTWMIWVDGYLSGLTGDTSFDPDLMATNTENLMTACAESPDEAMLDVLHGLIGE